MVIARFPVFAAVALAGTACSVSPMDTTSLSGPSELALSFQVAASPDSIRQDGTSSSNITVTARGPNGAGLPGVVVRLDLLPADYGRLSSQEIVTGSDGSARATYTAPPPQAVNAPIGTCSSSGVTLVGYCVEVAATPVGSSSFGSNGSRRAQIHLIPSGTITAPADPAAPVASFLYSPTSPRKATQVLFDGSASRAQSGRRIEQDNWSWGDGQSATRPGPSEDHDYPDAGLYPVTLTVTDDAGLSGSSVQVINVVP